MVEKGLGGVYTQFVYRPDGSLMSLYSGGVVQTQFQLPGGATAIYNAIGLNYIRHTDWLGSSRFATTWNHTVYSKEAYAPFGEAYNEDGTPDRSFTGQDQNVVTGAAGTGVYDFLFRKYDPSAGRWLSPDPAGWQASSLRHPQSLNRYAYVQNNPLSLVDPYGLDFAWQNSNASVSIPPVTIVSGDCPTTGPGANGVYIDADGVTSVSFDANGDESGYAIGGTMYDPNGSVFTPDLIAIGFGVMPGGNVDPTYSYLSSIVLTWPEMPNNPAPDQDIPLTSRWPLNGNLVPLNFKKQDEVCTTGPAAEEMNRRPGVLSCCRAHDDCYTKYQCNATSFSPVGFPGSCKLICNATVVACLAMADKSKGD